MSPEIGFLLWREVNDTAALVFGIQLIKLSAQFVFPYHALHEIKKIRHPSNRRRSLTLSRNTSAQG